jgi:hypothetical protein
VNALALNPGTNSLLQFVITGTENKYLTNREHSLWDNGEIFVPWGGVQGTLARTAAYAAGFSFSILDQSKAVNQGHS